MTIVGFIAALLGLLGLFWGMVERSNRKLGMLVAIYILHLLTTLVYYVYVQTNDADTALYYFDVYNFYYYDFSLGTLAIVHIVQWLKSVIGGTYLDYFLLWQVMGVWGIMLLIRSMEETLIALNQPWGQQYTIIAFLPGMYFWTSAIGKDAPLFLACTLTIWATLRFSSRWFWIGVALVMMVLIRPHVAVITLLALMLAMVTGRGVAPAVRILAILIAIIATFYIGRTLQSDLKIDTSSIGSIANFVDTQTSTASAASGEAGESIALPYPLKLMSLLYRPFFIDSGGIFGLVASVQNIFMLFATYVFYRELRTWRAMYRASLPIRFATIFMFGMILMLTVMYYNVGLGLRQREMFTPALLILFTALFSYRTGIARTVNDHTLNFHASLAAKQR